MHLSNISQHLFRKGDNTFQEKAICQTEELPKVAGIYFFLSHKRSFRYDIVNLVQKQFRLFLKEKKSGLNWISTSDKYQKENCCYSC